VVVRRRGADGGARVIDKVHEEVGKGMGGAEEGIV
jgi:hypothetical protein